MSEFYKRTLTGVAIIAVIVCCVMLSRYSFFGLCFVICFLALVEFFRLLNVRKWPFRIFGFLLSSTLLITVFLFKTIHSDWSVLLINLPVVSLIFISIIFFVSGNVFEDVAFVFLGQIYITLSLILLYLSGSALDGVSYNPNVILGYFFFLWANDTGAYVFGSLFGKHKLAPSVSPNKTWEGSAGGAFVVMVVVYVNYHFFRDLSLLSWIVIGFIVVSMGTLGDLTKSVLKRSRNVKDFGSILPGHGGILDRFDSMIGSVPFVYMYLYIFH